MKRSLSALFPLLAVTGLLFSRCGDAPQPDSSPSNSVDSVVDSNSKSAGLVIDPLFQGEYITPAPAKIDKGSYYTDLIISRQKGKDSLKIVFSSAKIKEKVCCSLSCYGGVKNDTLFVPLIQTSSNLPAIMLITHNTRKGIGNSINISMKDTSQANLLMSYCCSGASLGGNYFPCDLSLFRTDTTKANQNTNNLLK